MEIDGEKGAARAALAETKAPKSFSAAVRDALKEDDAVRAVLGQHVAARAEATRPWSERAKTAFESFRPTVFTAAQLDQSHYVPEGGRLGGVQQKVVENGVGALRETADQRALTVHTRAGSPFADDKGAAKKMALADLIALLASKVGDGNTLRQEVTRTACNAKAFADGILSEVEAKNGHAPGKAAGAVGDAAPGGNGQKGNGADGSAAAEAFVKAHVPELMAEVTPPEEQVSFNGASRASLSETEQNVTSFELRAGASDVTSYHDFNSLQIAFEYIWTEIFDKTLKSLGVELYHEAVALEDFLHPTIPSNINFDITSTSDLLNLIAEAESLRDLAADLAPGMQTIGQFVDGQLVTRQVPNIPGAERLSRLLDEISLRLSAPYSFSVFAKNSFNFGILVTYRQTWRPEKYQVGELVSTIPLAPRETRRYTTKTVVKKNRAEKAIEDSVRTLRTESSETSRVDREIVDSAKNKTDFDVTAHGSFGSKEGGYQVDGTTQTGGEQSNQSKATKKHFHEAVLKSAEEYKQQHRTEVDTSLTEETEDTTFHEIQNPNDELTVTYMLYELERTYFIDEKIHQVTPVVLVANEVPAPNAIDDAWLTTYDWILRRVLLDDSFKPALDYLTKSFLGAELNIQYLQGNAEAQKKLVDDLKNQITAQLATLAGAEQDLYQKQTAEAGGQVAEGILETVKHVFDPFQLTGKDVLGLGQGTRAMVDFAQESVDRAEREKARLLDQLGAATTSLQVAIDKLSEATVAHYDKIAEIDRLRIHVKDNILYYMQAIWSHEPPDQRFFRIYNIDVTIAEPDTSGQQVAPQSPGAGHAALADALRGTTTGQASLPVPPVQYTKKKLVEIADLDTVLGYKGNYAIYALKENNYLTLHMMQDYLEVSDQVALRDPDDLGSYTVDDLRQLAECLYKTDRDTYNNHREELKQLMIDRYASGQAEDDRVIVPTKSLYIEALVGTHPLLEDFKLIHRALDVKRVQADVRHAELENVRLGARALKGKDGDPDIEKKIVIEPDTKTRSVMVGADGN